MWPIYDNDDWIGWMGKGRYNQNGAPFAWDTLVTHWNGEGKNGGSGQTTSTTSDKSIWGICMNCTGEL
jgi:hypothetical protein